jgi:hypothetical protein
MILIIGLIVVALGIGCLALSKMEGFLKILSFILMGAGLIMVFIAT